MSTMLTRVAQLPPPVTLEGLGAAPDDVRYSRLRLPDRRLLLLLLCIPPFSHLSPCLVAVAQADAAPLVGFDALLEAGIVEVGEGAKHVCQRRLLRGRREQPELVERITYMPAFVARNPANTTRRNASASVVIRSSDWNLAMSRHML
jgi:hypothetical protein